MTYTSTANYFNAFLTPSPLTKSTPPPQGQILDLPLLNSCAEKSTPLYLCIYLVSKHKDKRH